VRKTIFTSWRASFFTGLAVALPALLTLAAVKWIFGTISSFTDTLLFFLPMCLPADRVFEDGHSGPMLWYWSLLALLLAVLLVSGVGLLARYYIGKRIIEWLDTGMMHVPLLNKFYSAIKQLNDSFSGSKSSFKTVVLVEFPRAGAYSVGFLTSDDDSEASRKTGEKLVSVFIPTTPNPTSGFLVLVPADQVTKLDMSVADGVKYIVSLGAIAPELPAEPQPKRKSKP
jgi:uncharacterized membrane protein